MKKHIFFIYFFPMFYGVHANAADIFSANIAVGTQPAVRQSYSTLKDMVAQYTSANLRSDFPSYRPNQPINAVLNIRGLEGTRIEFLENSAQLMFSIPSLGISEKFGQVDGVRNDSRRLFLNFLEGQSGKDILQRINHALVSSSPIDPVIGNPNSLAATMVNQSYGQAAILTEVVSDARSSVALAPRFGRYTQRGIDTDVLTLPLTYSIKQNKAATWVIDAPLTLINMQEALSGSGSVGVGYRYAVQDDWQMMPSLSIGLTASDDLGVAAMIYGVGAVSNYRFYDQGSSKWSAINLVSLYKTESVKLGDFSSAYDLLNVVSRQGLQYEKLTNIYLKGQPFVWNAQIARTDYFGDDVYSKFSHDLSLSLGVKSSDLNSIVKEYRMGFTYTIADGDINGLQMNAGYTF